MQLYKSNWTRTIAALAILTSTIFVKPAVMPAQEKQNPEITAEDIFALMEMGNVTTATRTERLLKTAPQPVTVITRQQLDAMGAMNIVDALRLVPGMNTRLSPMGYTFGIRSLG